jgi:putative ABC transport system substrate-binding protein
VAVIAAISGTPAGLAAKAATATIPIVFTMGSDPVETGLVTSLSRPSGNVTGVTFFNAALGTKRLEFLRVLVPTTTTIAVLTNSNNPASVMERAHVEAAAQAIGQHTQVFDAHTEDDIDRAVAAIGQQRMGALLVFADPLFLNQRHQLVTLVARHAVPAIYADRDYAEAGGLISYGTSRTEAYRHAGIYVGRILKGEPPSNLPVMLPTKFELVINLKTAQDLGLTMPPWLLSQADEVIK